MGNADFILKLVTLFGIFVVALIPAFIAKSKNRSFIKFYLFGIVLIIPAIVVAIILSDPEDEAIVKGKGVWLVIAVISFYFIIKNFTKFIDYHLLNYIDSAGIAYDDSKYIAIMILALLLDVLITTVLSIIVADIISRPIIVILFSYISKAREFDDRGKAITLFKGVLFSIFLHEENKARILNQKAENFNKKYSNPNRK